MKSRIPLAIFTFAFLSCSRNDQSNSGSTNVTDTLAVISNNKGARLLGRLSKFNSDSMNHTIFDSALIYLNRAIEIDRNYLVAHANKATLFRKMGLLRQSLAVLHRMEELYADDPGIVMEQAFTLEKTGQLDSAQGRYWHALELLEKKLDREPFNVKIKSDIAFLYIFLENKNYALMEIQALVSKYPDDPNLRQIQVYISDFDRQKFIEEY